MIVYLLFLVLFIILNAPWWAFLCLGLVWGLNVAVTVAGW
jgi:hypothetical protein